MRKNLIATLLFVLLTKVLTGQCPTAEILLTDQVSIDNFSTRYPGCSVIEHNLIIADQDNHSIFDLTGLSGIRVIKGYLKLSGNHALRTLDGLENVDTVYGQLSIEHNKSLTDLAALDGLQYTGGIQMTGCDSIRILNAFNGLVSTAGISFRNNANLQAIHGFTSLRQVSALQIHYEDKLTDLSGFSHVDTIRESLELHDLTAIPRFTGFNSLHYIGRSLFIAWNNKLTDLDGFDNLNHIGEEILIGVNDSLLSIEALASVIPDTIMDIAIYANPKLQACQVNWLCEVLSTAEHQVYLEENGKGCGTYFDILDECNLAITCLPTLVFGRQSEIDSFPYRFPQCTSVEGDLVIAEAFDDSITNLQPLEQLISIGGSFTVEYTKSLTSLDGLSPALSIGGDLDLNRNQRLQSISALSGLTAITGNVNIYNNPALVDLYGLHRIKTITGEFNLEQNLSLVNLSGLDSVAVIGNGFKLRDLNIQALEGLNALQSISGSLQIQECPALLHLDELENITSLQHLNLYTLPSLQSIDGLRNLSNVEGNLQVRDVNRLRDLSALQQVQTIAGSLTIWDNDSLTSLQAFNLVQQIGNDLQIGSNSQLTQLTGLNNIRSVGWSLSIGYHPSLELIDAFASLDSVGGHITLIDNPRLREAIGFGALDSIGYDLVIQNNPLLDTLPQFTELTFIGRNLRIEQTGLHSLGGLNRVTVVVGETEIAENAALITLDGLQSLTTIGGLRIAYNPQLVNMDSLYGLRLLTDSLLVIANNQLLERLPAWHHLAGVASIYLSENPSLTSLVGLDSLRQAGSIYLYNLGVHDLSGFANLEAIHGNFEVHSNNVLYTLDGIENLQHIAGRLSIRYNDILTDIEALSLVNPESLSAVDNETHIAIYNNPELGDCSIAFLCEKLLLPDIRSYIQGNATGCDNKYAIIQHCEYSNACAAGQLILSRQTQIDSFPIVFPGCEFVKGSVTINESVPGSVLNLDSLAAIRRIGGALHIRSNTTLSDIAGLSNLTEVGGNLIIEQNPMLTSLQSLSGIRHETFNQYLSMIPWMIIRNNTSLTFCSIDPVCSLLVTPGQSYTIVQNADGCKDDDDVIDHCGFPSTCELYELNTQQMVDEIPRRFPRCTHVLGEIYVSDYFDEPIFDLSPLSQFTHLTGQLFLRYNDYIVNLNGLDNLAHIRGPILLQGNASLQNIDALSNISTEAGQSKISKLTISDNTLLDECTAVCDLLRDTSLLYTISNNRSGCSSREEILDICTVSVEPTQPDDPLTLYPNPTSGELHIVLRTPGRLGRLQIIDLAGRLFLQQDDSSTLDLSSLPTGFYIVSIEYGEGQVISRRIAVLTH